MNRSPANTFRRPGSSAATRPYTPVIDGMRQRLSAQREPTSIRAQHVAALVAWAPVVTYGPDQVVAEFDCDVTALWLARALRSPRVALRDDARTQRIIVQIDDPRPVLGGFGYRDGRWIFRPGNQAGVGIARGAVHAAGQLSRAGLRIPCPSTAAMLTLLGVLSRLGISARASDITQRVLIGRGDVPKLLSLLGIDELGTQYRQLASA